VLFYYAVLLCSCTMQFTVYYVYCAVVLRSLTVTVHYGYCLLRSVTAVLYHAVYCSLCSVLYCAVFTVHTVTLLCSFTVLCYYAVYCVMCILFTVQFDCAVLQCSLLVTVHMVYC
jgi:hypothetical protein